MSSVAWSGVLAAGSACVEILSLLPGIKLTTVIGVTIVPGFIVCLDLDELIESKLLLQESKYPYPFKNEKTIYAMGY